MGFNALSGLNVLPILGVKVPDGTFSIRNSVMENGQIPNGALYSVPNIRHVIFDNLKLSTLQGDLFFATKELVSMTLNNNVFTSLPTKLFDKITMLTTVNLYGVTWDCTCDSLWWLTSLQTNNISLHGDVICSNTSTFPGSYSPKT